MTKNISMFNNFSNFISNHKFYFFIFLIIISIISNILCTYLTKFDKIITISDKFIKPGYRRSYFEVIDKNDQTYIITDNIYFDVWSEILSKYYIVLTQEIYKKFIQGNNDNYILNTLLINTKLSLSELSNLKDKLFIQNINKIKKRRPTRRKR